MQHAIGHRLFFGGSIMQNRYRRSLLLVTVLVGAAVGIATQALAQFTQQGPKLVGTLPVGRSQQGYSVALSADGDIAIVGGPSDNSQIGAAWVYTRRGGIWHEHGNKLVGTGLVGNAEQGWSVALSADGDTAIVGGPFDNNGIGAAWVFTRRRGVWTQQGDKLVGGGAVGNAGQGISVALSADGHTAIVGGPFDNANGAAWVFTRSRGVWTQQGDKLVGSGAVGDAAQGRSVALSADGNTAIVGGPGDLNTDPFRGGAVGAAWVFTRSGGVWTQQGPKLVGTDAVPDSNQGWSVALSADGNTAILGGPEDPLRLGIGAAWIFTRGGDIWTQQSNKLIGTGYTNPARQGWSVALSADGNTAIVGGPFDTNLMGAVWVYTRSGGAWTQQSNKLVGTGAVGTATSNAEQGWSVALSADGNTAIAGGPFDNSGNGAAWVFIQPTKDDCKDGGWLNFVSPTSPFTFTNQDQCVSYSAQQK
jgi:antibiotic biosynthesis monooxygenase (ABM) superfamily enzyme